jgi:hypothetical protein
MKQKQIDHKRRTVFRSPSYDTPLLDKDHLTREWPAQLGKEYY